MSKVAKKWAKSMQMDRERRSMGDYTELWRKEMKITKGMENDRRGQNN